MCYESRWRTDTAISADALSFVCYVQNIEAVKAINDDDQHIFMLKSVR